MATTTQTADRYNTTARTDVTIDARIRDVARPLAPAGRILFALIFVFSSLGHFSSATIGYAEQSGVPMANLLVPASGVLALAGGVLIALGWHARVGALLLLAFLLPVTFAMHDFWSLTDPMERMNQQVHFMKNLSMIGGALLLAYFGSGPISLDRKDTDPMIA